MLKTPMGFRHHIAIFGRMNVGKSTLINAITNQELAVVSEVPGTTTDPVFKTMELLPIGPVVIIDTAGLNDESQLGNLRQEKTFEVMRKANFSIIVMTADEGLTDFERKLAAQLKTEGIPLAGVINKTDLFPISKGKMQAISNELEIPVISVSSKTGQGIEELKELIAQTAVFDKSDFCIINDIISPGDLCVLVTHIDCAAPQGRLILPQQQTIRDIIDSHATAVVTQEIKLKETLSALKQKPAIVVTDSLVSDIAAESVPENLPLTSFSILIARQKGDLEELLAGLKQISRLPPRAKLLVAENCTHRRQEDDLAKIKIPAYIKKIIKGDVELEWISGSYFPPDIEKYDGIIHCGGCMVNRKEMLYRLNHAKTKGIPITNYGMLIAFAQGILQRMLAPFPGLGELLPV